MTRPISTSPFTAALDSTALVPNAAFGIPTRLEAVSSLTPRPSRHVPVLPDQGVATVAPFANPFARGASEALMIRGGRLHWVTPLEGIRQDLGLAEQVVTVLHPQGTLCAFALHTGTNHRTYVYQYLLQQQLDGSLEWKLTTFDPPGIFTATHLSVQYDSSRPAGAFVFVIGDQLGTENSQLFVIASAEATNDQDPLSGDLWQLVATRHLQEPGIGATDVVCGADGTAAHPADFWIWSRRGAVLTQWWLRPDGTDAAVLTRQAVTMGGPFVTETGVGVVYAQNNDRGAPYIVVASGLAGFVPTTATYPSPGTPQRLRPWEDSGGRLHVFLHTGGTSFSMLRQGGVHAEYDAAGNGRFVPELATMTVADVPYPVELDLLTDVDSWTVDPRPSKEPRLWVGHTANRTPADQSVLYALSARSGWLGRERLVVGSTTAFDLRICFATRARFTTAYGGPAANRPVELSSPQPVQATVAGRTYRLGPDQAPVRLVTDLRGDVIVEVPAMSLTGVDLTFTARGMAQSVTVNPAADLQRFLAGTGTLPNFPDGISPALLEQARDVFPHLGTGQPTDPHPTAEQLVTLCRELLRAPDEDEEEATEQQDSPAEGGETPPVADGKNPLTAGDLWVAQQGGDCPGYLVEIDPVSRTAVVYVMLTSKGYVPVTVSSATTTDAVHVVEALLGSVGATVPDVLGWLSWGLDLHRVFVTKDAIVDGLGRLEDYLNGAFATALGWTREGWFAAQKAHVSAALTSARVVLDTVNLDGDTAPPPVVTGGASAVAAIASDAPRQDNPHVSWLLEELWQLEDSAMVADSWQANDPPPEFGTATIALQQLLALLTSRPAGKALLAAVANVQPRVTHLVQPTDPGALSHSQLSDLLGCYDDLIGPALDFCDLARPQMAKLVAAMLRCVKPALSVSPVSGSAQALEQLWTDISSRAGRADPLNVGNLFGVLAGLTVGEIFAAVTGFAPFQHGTAPVLPVAVTNEDESRSFDAGWQPGDRTFRSADSYAVPPLDQLTCQLGAGLARRGTSWKDQYLSTLSRTPDGPDPLPEPGQRYWAMGSAVSDLFFRGFAELPVFYGVPPAGSASDPSDRLWWAEYLGRLPLLLGDFVSAIAWPGALGKPLGDYLLGSVPNEPGAELTTALAAVSVAFRLVLMEQPDARDGVNVAWDRAQIFGLLSDLTAVLRLGSELTDDATYALVSALQVGADNAASSWRSLNAAGAMSSRSILGTPPAGVVGTAYDEAGVGTLTHPFRQWTPLGWKVDDLPPGLSFEVVGDDADRARLVGIPTQAGTFVVKVSAACSYRPNLFVTTPFTVVVTEPADEG